MFRRLIVALCIFLVACGAPAPAPPTSAPSSTTAPESTTVPVNDNQEAIAWEKPYDSSSYVDPSVSPLCPEDGTADGQPLFGPITDGKLGAQSVLIVHGLYANKQNEVFRIDVIATDQAALNAYISELRVCLDHILLTSTTVESKEAPSGQGEASAPFGSAVGDISTEVYMQGYLDPGLPPENVYEVLKNLTSQPVEQWMSLLAEQKMLTPEQAYPDRAKQDFLIAFIIDPTVASAGRHQYPEKVVSSVYVTASVRDGTGSVSAGICRNSSAVLAGTRMTVTHGGTPDTASKSDRQNVNQTYDLGILGNSPSGGRYRISGVWWMPGWSANYWDAVPAGSRVLCNP